MKTILKVEGMACNHCAHAIKAELSEIEGVKEVVVSLEEKTVTVEHEGNVAESKLKESIEGLGYKVVL
ncbi:MAG: heavy-metal-associated domain-containing protein [Clostridia bacterium]